MPKDREICRANKRKYQGSKRGSFKHRPTVRIPDPTAWGWPLRSNWNIEAIRRGKNGD